MIQRDENERRWWCAVRGCLMAMLLGGVLILGGFADAQAGAQSSSRAEAQLQPTSLPQEIWVADFDIDVDRVHKEGILENSGPLKRRGVAIERPLGRRQSPEQVAAELVNTLSVCLTEELKTQSLPARRLAPNQPLPRTGWVIQGQFVEVDQGNRVRRAVIGFGAGATSMQIEARVTNVGATPGTPFLLLGTQADSGKMPGAIVTMNPYVAAAKFVLAKNASTKDVGHSAKEMVAEIAKYLKSIGLPVGK